MTDTMDRNSASLRVLMFPGQGSQRPGLLKPWLNERKESIEKWSNAIDLDLHWFGSQADENELLPTEVVQPLLCAAGMLAVDEWKTLNPQTPMMPVTTTGVADNSEASISPTLATVGHSAGQTPAAYAAGWLSDVDTICLARQRGLFMSRAAAQNPGAMAVVIFRRPITLAEVEIWAEEANVEVANVNMSTLYVVAGAKNVIENLGAPPGAFLRPLAVSGAFHSKAMRSAQEYLKNFLDTLVPNNFSPTIPFLSNASGRPLANFDEFKTEMVNQLVDPVRWDIVMQWMKESQVTHAIEMSPAATLGPFLKRTVPQVTHLEFLGTSLTA